jgi:hypothetical protein
MEERSRRRKKAGDLSPTGMGVVMLSDVTKIAVWSGLPLFGGGRKRRIGGRKWKMKGKSFAGVEKGTQNCGIDCGSRAIRRPTQSSIVERMRAAVVVARLEARGGNI